jgi:hypothetical protein
MIEKGSTLPFDVKDFRSLTYDLSITAFKEKTHINRLIGMLGELKRSGWQVEDIFRAYRTKHTPPAYSDIQSYGIRITAPDPAAPINVTDVHGVFQLIPPGHELRTLRYYPRQNGFIPNGAIAIDRATNTWRVSGFDIGGQPGEERGIDIALVGPGAKVLLDYWIEANGAHYEVQKALLGATGQYGRWLPPITTWPEDLVTCHRLLVKRK